MKLQLKETYDHNARFRDTTKVQSWKIAEMDRFIAKLQEAGLGRRVLDLGSGPGQQAMYLQDHGCEVHCVDLSDEMVRICKEKGLEATVMDFYSLDLEQLSFDAVWCMNALLHVPKDSLGKVLGQVEKVIKPDGFVYMGLYGGYESEGIWEDDDYLPQRFFSFYEDDHIQHRVNEVFTISEFYSMPVEGSRLQYQAMVAWKKQNNPLKNPN
ncbi:class I SAM-dependent methyltransferase [Paenibacillus hexagrammi]|uniref:Class I SAM-dependent methyltransferase n=1 Tax=Paenibacillus hexagrammi TaxID=2908839 RepID=A0ABY3SRW4_9BACL|nr:class I SAM-dependent methyltransferase [Paenibacillus sp. YPD9-1]UJF35845.1 class I SAM-dependent methyltransferase [Paenibacillus sp. YPD9-1]